MPFDKAGRFLILFKMKKPQIRTLKLVIAVGETSVKESISDMPMVQNVFMGATAKPAQDQLVRISAEVNNQTVQEPLDANWFDGKLGSFEQRALLLDWKGGAKIEIKAEVDTAVTGRDLEIEAVLVGYPDGSVMTTQEPCY